MDANHIAERERGKKLHRRAQVAEGKVLRAVQELDRLERALVFCERQSALDVAASIIARRHMGYLRQALNR